MKAIIVAGMMAASVVAHAGDFQSIVDEAYAINKQAAQAQFEWRDTVMFIKEAVALKAEGKHDEAMAKVKSARHQAALSLQQSVDQADAGPVKSSAIQPY